MRIDQIPLPAGQAGRLYATGFTVVGPDPDAALRHVEADVLLCLITRHEIHLRFPAFEDWLTAAVPTGRARHFPMDDGGTAPTAEMVALVDELGARLDRGEAIVVHCGAGLGRISLVSGLLLVRAGMDLPDALVAVRAGRPGAGPENPVQRAYLQELAPLVSR